MDFFEVVHTQRAIRRFRDEPVSDEAVRTILDAAIRAPSGSNLQPWRWIVVRDATVKARLAESLLESVEASGFLPMVRDRLDGARSWVDFTMVGRSETSPGSAIRG